jgi:acetylornithine aminotransferase
MLGVEFHAAAGDVVKGLRAAGILATKAGDNVLRLLPPLTIKGKEIEEFLAALESVLKEGGAS